MQIYISPSTVLFTVALPLQGCQTSCALTEGTCIASEPDLVSYLVMQQISTTFHYRNAIKCLWQGVGYMQPYPLLVITKRFLIDSW